MQKTDIAVAKFNARLAILSSFLSQLVFILPVWLLYSLNILHLQPTLAIAIYMSIWIVSALLEVPTGALADRLGRKKIYMLGQVLFSLYPLAYALQFPVLLLFAVCLISAVGGALRSGALLPIVHKAYERAGLDETEYNKFLSNNQVATFVGRILTGVVGAWLYTINPTWPFFAMFIVGILSFALGFYIKDDVVEVGKEISNTAHIKATLGILRKSDVVVAALLAFIAFDLTAETVWTGYQVFFSNDGNSTIVIGILFSLIAVCSALGSFFARYGLARFHPFRFMQLNGLAIFLTALLLAQPNHMLRLLAIIPMGLGSIQVVIISSVIQKHVRNRYQATALSVFSFLQGGIYAIGSIAFGVLLQSFGDSGTRMVLLGTSAVALVGMTLYGFAHKSVTDDIVTSTHDVGESKAGSTALE